MGTRRERRDHGDSEANELHFVYIMTDC